MYLCTTSCQFAAENQYQLVLNDRETCHKPSSLVGAYDRLLNVRTSKNVDLLSCFSIYKMFHQVVAHWEEGGSWGGGRDGGD